MKEFVFRGLRLQSTEEKQKLVALKNPIPSSEVHDNSLLDIIFAPDPVTGNPRSDLFMDLHADPNIKDFVRRELQSVRLNLSKIENSDDALDFTKSRFESAEDYINRVKGYFVDSHN